MRIDVENISGRNGYLLEMQRQANSNKEKSCNDNIELRNRQHATELRLNQIESEYAGNKKEMDTCRMHND